MGGIFKGPKKPEPPKPPPSVDTEGVNAAADAERRRQRAASGRAATMLTSGSGLGTSAPTGTKKLLGR
jgi:hypothetical protein